MKFIQQNYRFIKRLDKKWRKPKGLQSKLGVGKKGSGQKPNVGYKKQKEIRGKINGMAYVLVRNINDLAPVGKDKGIILASCIGARKSLEIARKAKELGISILNMKKVRNGEKMFMARQAEKKKNQTKKEKQKEEKKAVEAQKEKKEAHEKADAAKVK